MLYKLIIHFEKRDIFKNEFYFLDSYELRNPIRFRHVRPSVFPYDNLKSYKAITTNISGYGFRDVTQTSVCSE